MLQPREGEIDYKDLDELAPYYMFISACLPKNMYTILKSKWNEQGGTKTISWWKFVMKNIKIEMDLQK